MKYEIILFDLDDTLFEFDLSEKKALNKAFLKFDLPTGLADYRDSYKEISRSLWSDLEQGVTTLSELGVERFRRLFQAHKLELDAKQFNTLYLGFLGEEAYLIQGALELCTSLSKYRLAILTNGFKDVQESKIKRSPLCNTFEEIISSEEAGSQKPAAGIFDYTFSKLQITDKSKVLMVGDSLTSDIQGGINYGIDTCWFNRHRKGNQTKLLPTYEIHELSDLIKIVG
ncbi:MAG: YjjG family noncanonical pyrimidine nucleotidase [Bacillota bacterium]